MDAYVWKRCGAEPQATRHRRSVSPNPNSGRRSRSALYALSLTLTHGNSDTGSTRSFSTPDSDARDARADAHVCKRCGAAPQATRHRRSVSPNPSGRRSGGLRCISNSKCDYVSKFC